MGCDIHPHIEIKVNGEWQHYTIPHLQRNYALFAKAADVRNHDERIEPIAAPRGIPKDATLVTRKSYEDWGTDAHSASWLDAKELAELIHFHESQSPKEPWKVTIEEWGYLEGNSFDGFTDYPEDRPNWIQDLRFIFWFDN